MFLTPPSLAQHAGLATAARFNLPSNDCPELATCEAYVTNRECADGCRRMGPARIAPPEALPAFHIYARTGAL